MQLEAVLFDFDGTILDTNELIRQSHLKTLEHYFPGKFNEEAVLAFNGPSLYEVYHQLDGENYQEMIDYYRAFNHQQHDNLVRLFPDTEKMLQTVGEAGLKMAIVSTKFRFALEKGLDLFQLHDYFDVVLGGDDYEKTKPDPEALFLALEKLGVPKEKAVMVGDNWQDLEAARRAGIPGIFVGWSEKEATEMARYNPVFSPQTMLELGNWLKKKR